MSALPWTDPQFWVVSLAALAALALALRPYFARRGRAAGELPCPRCARCAGAATRSEVVALGRPVPLSRPPVERPAPR